MRGVKYFKSLNYDVIIRRRDLDGEQWYEAYCEELGRYSCYGIGDTQEEALKSFMAEKDSFIEQLYESNEVIPLPCV